MDGQAYTANAAGSFVFGSQTLAPAGPPITVDGHTLSLFGPLPSAAVVDGSTQPLVPIPLPTPAAGGAGPAVLTLGGQTYTANNAGSFVVGSQTLTPGGPAVTVDGTTISLLPTPTAAIIDGSTEYLGPGPTAAPAGVITLDGTIYTEDASGDLVVNGKTILPGGSPVTLGTEVVSLGPGGSVVVVDGTTMTLAGAVGASTTTEPQLTGSAQGTAAVAGPSTSLALQAAENRGARQTAGRLLTSVVWALGAAALLA